MRKSKKGSSKILAVAISTLMVFCSFSPAVFATEIKLQEGESEVVENEVDVVSPITNPETTELPVETENPNEVEDSLIEETFTPKLDFEDNETENPTEQSTTKLIQSINKLDERFISSQTTDSMYSLFVNLNTTFEELQLPSTILVIVNDKEEEISITWISDSEYVSNENGQFIFTAVLPEDYDLIESVVLPQIHVSIGEQENLITTMSLQRSQPISHDVSQGDVIIDTCSDTCPGHEITGSTTQYKIVVKNGTHTISINNVNIDLSRTVGGAFQLQNDSSVDLNLTGENRLKSSEDNAGISVPENASITIDGLGSITAEAGASAAGIGNGLWGNVGSITIKGGKVTAKAIKSNGEPAGIGSCAGGSAGTIKITGGVVNAFGSGRGIGGGAEATKGSIEISGGIVTADGIGTGNYYTSTNTQILGNALVFCNGSINKTNQSSWNGIVFEEKMV